MPSDPESAENFTPSEATLLAWEAQAHMLEYANCKPGSVHAEAAKQQANQAFGAMVAVTEDFLHSSARVRSQGTDDEIADILQETYLRAYKYLPKFRGDAQVETWLHKIMYRCVSTFYDKKSRLPDPVEHDNAVLGELAVSEALDTDTLAITDGMHQDLIDMVDSLSPTHRRVLYLRVFQDLSNEQAAKILGTTQGAVKTRMCRALAAFRENFPHARDILEE
ncbi:MAG: polymerase sigma-70 factor, subfamily [Patescibacteria group bacterium]|nr:polymerase sigma-70 factor, subfamily [Patescibacteria group bacterium]